MKDAVVFQLTEDASLPNELYEKGDVVSYETLKELMNQYSSIEVIAISIR